MDLLKGEREWQGTLSFIAGEDYCFCVSDVCNFINPFWYEIFVGLIGSFIEKYIHTEELYDRHFFDRTFITVLGFYVIFNQKVTFF